jgi:hypothetical protein
LFQSQPLGPLNPPHTNPPIVNTAVAMATMISGLQLWASTAVPDSGSTTKYV